MQQKRLLLASAISLAILIVWSYLLPVKPPEQTATPIATPSPQATVNNPQAVVTSSPSPENSPVVQQQNPERSLIVKTPLYEATFESRGAEPVSWIIKQNRESQNDIYSAASTRKDKLPLQLISAAGLKRQPREVPFQLWTGDSGVDGLHLR